MSVKWFTLRFYIWFLEEGNEIVYFLIHLSFLWYILETRVNMPLERWSWSKGICIYFFPLNSSILYWTFKKKIIKSQKNYITATLFLLLLLSLHVFFLKHFFCELLQLSWESCIGVLWASCRSNTKDTLRLW